MSDNTGIFYREIDGKWYSFPGQRSGYCYTDQDYIDGAEEHGSLESCLVRAHAHVRSLKLTGGLIHDPTPEPEPPPDPARVAACLEFCRGVSSEDLQRGVGVFVEAKREFCLAYTTPEVAQAIEVLKGHSPPPGPPTIAERLKRFTGVRDQLKSLRELAQAILDDATPKPDLGTTFWPIRIEHYRRLKELLA